MTTVRPAQPSDDQAIAAVTTAAFGDAHVAELVGLLAAGPARISLVAVDEDTVVGHTMLSRGWIDAEDALVETLVLSPLSVEPARQRAGIGSALVTAALEEADRAGAPAVFLEGDWRYYSRFGFEWATPRGFVRPSPRVPRVAFQVVVLSSWQDGMTGPLVYPDEFWQTDLVGLRGDLLRDVRAASGEIAD